ncbi:hypothetical protein CHH83_01735 [Bacillus sp. 7586-K]|nr:hypothetical protein CHH83_01735 [Bacillus sp. 7586-K]
MAKFFTYMQNNSFGTFDVNENVCETVIVEAENYQNANDKAEEIGIYFNGCLSGIDCHCCGDRWEEQEEWDEGYDVPSIHGTPVSEIKKSYFRNQCIIHYLNGSKETVKFR